VLVQVSAAALNPVDLLIASGGHPLGLPRLPYVPGVEGVGRWSRAGASGPVPGSASR
jgi:NADPH:quinone reductase-like Zn-dependent oxidoreductase